MKTLKGIISSFALLIVAGLLVTFTTKYVIAQKKEALYSYKENMEAVTSATGQTTEDDENLPDGPMSNVMTKSKYLEPIKSEEAVIADLWAGISDDSSAMRVVLYERNYLDNQFDRILQMYYELQLDDNMDILRQEEASFVEERESMAQEAAKAAGETFTGLQYIKEHVRLTKEKTYELIERYFAE